MKRWQIATMLGLVFGVPFLLNGNSLPCAALPAARAASDPHEEIAPAPAANYANGIADSIKQVIQMGILAWFCYFVTSKAGPAMVQNFREETKALRDANREEMRAEREAHRATLDKIAGDYRAQYGEAVKLFADRDRQTHDDLGQLGTTINEMVRHCAETTAKVAAGGPP